jgi:streptogramin lyase
MRLKAIMLASALMLAAAGLCAGGAEASPEGAIAEFSTPTIESEPSSIAPGTDGNLWFTEYKADKIGRITPNGMISEFPIPTVTGRPEGITPGPDGNMWFTERKGNNVGRITPSGAITEFSIPTVASEPEDIVLGPDGNLWFIEANGNKIGRITPSGAITEFPIPTTESRPQAIAAGPDGNLWFTEYKADQIGRITPSGAITEFPIPTAKSGPWGVAPGSDGNVWFTEFNQDQIGRITPSGTVTEFPIPTPKSFPGNIAPGPDGNLWFTEFSAGKVGRITPSGAITEFQLSNAESKPSGIAPGADGNMWFVEAKGDKIGQIGAGVSGASAAPPVVSGDAQAGTAQLCNAAWATWASQPPSASLFGFDGYSWQLDGAQVATGQSYTPTADQAGHELSCAETVTYPMLDVTAVAASSPTTVLAPAPPAITEAHESASTWREGDGLARISRVGPKRLPGRRRLPPRGTTLSFLLSESASVSFSFTQRLSGREAGNTCVATSRTNAKRRRCERTATVGKLSFAGRLGADKVVFQGRLSRSKRLKPGRYTLLIVATNSEGARSAPASLSFTIVA